jgi:hypothetical protein
MRSGLRWARLALAAVIVTGGVALVLPAGAFAATKAATRIVVTSQVIVDWGTTPGFTPAVPVVTAKLQKKSGSKWVALKGAVKVAFWDQWNDVWVPQGTHTVSSLPVSLTTRGRYRLLFAGSSSSKAATAYTKRIDKIGETVSHITASIDTTTGTWTYVHVSYDVNWNTDAYFHDGDFPIEFSYSGTFDTGVDGGPYSGYVYHAEEMFEPGTVEFSYRVHTADIPASSSLHAFGEIYSNDDYILTTARQEDYIPQ